MERKCLNCGKEIDVAVCIGDIQLPTCENCYLGKKPTTKCKVEGCEAEIDEGEDYCLVCEKKVLDAEIESKEGKNGN